jgi:multidrug efflux pump subunit AcrA (membrane-fusion protein)
VVKPVSLTSHWRTIQVPGQVTEFPGRSDHAVTSPVAGVVKRVAVFPWDTVKPGDELFTLGLAGEIVQSTQAELFKTARDLEINQEERQRLADVSRAGTVPATRLLELEYQQRRLNAALLAYRHQLAARGLTPAQVQDVIEGRFVTEMTIRVPGHLSHLDGSSPTVFASTTAAAEKMTGPLYEVQELKVNLGEQVQPGQLLCYLTDHQALYVEGRGFKQEVPLLERAARQGWFVQADFAQDEAEAWLPFRRELPVLALAGLVQRSSVVPLFPPDGLLPISFLANTVDPGSQTYPFYLPLTNPYREYVNAGKTYRIWRFRPGQRVQLHVPVERFEEVFVLPAEAVVREGAEAYVFRQNGDFFERKPVHLVHLDRHHAVIANDGSISPVNFLAHTAAAQLNFALKAQSAGGDEGGHHHHHHDH